MRARGRLGQRKRNNCSPFIAIAVAELLRLLFAPEDIEDLLTLSFPGSAPIAAPAFSDDEALSAVAGPFSDPSGAMVLDLVIVWVG